MDPEITVRRFNEAINDNDLSALVALMTDDHRFVDSSGKVTEGRGPVEDAWDSFFRDYPGYTNHIERVVERHGDVIIVVGRSSCPGEPALEGPAIWTARVRDGQLSEWCVYSDDSSVRHDLLGE